MQKKVKTSNVTLYWICDKCNETAETPLIDLDEFGTPYCDDCEDDMILDDYIKIEVPE